MFDDGAFSENSTFLISEWFAHTPRDVLAKNFGVQESDFDNLPRSERYIFQGRTPGPLQEDRAAAPNGPVPLRFSHQLLSQDPLRSPGGNGANRRFKQLPGSQDDRRRIG